LEAYNLRILIASDVYPPQPRGAAKQVQLLARELSRRDHEVSVCTTAIPGQPKYEEDNALKIYRLQGFFSRIPFLYRDPVDRFPPPLKDWLLARELRRVFQKEKPDIVHANGWIVYSIIPILRESNVPLVFSLLGYETICPASGMVKKAAVCDMSLNHRCIPCSRELYGLGLLGTAKSLAVYFATKANKSKLKSVDRFIASNSHVKQVHLRHLGVDEEDIVVIRFFKYAPAMNGQTEMAGDLPQDFVLFVGALIPVKGVDVLIEAYQKLSTRTKLVLIGVKRHGYHYKSGEGILLVEDAPDDVVMQAYQNCRFAIFPSVWPDFPTVAIEAMSHKKAIIASRIGGFPDLVVDKETGILVPPNDVEALSDAMRYLLENPEVASTMGQKGYERWRRLFTPEVAVARIEKLYQSLFEDAGYCKEVTKA